MGTKEEKRARQKALALLLQDASDKGGISKADICKRFGIKKQTFYNDLDDIENKMGIMNAQYIAPDGKTRLFFIERDVEVLDPVDKQAIDRYRITRILEKGSLCESEILPRYKADFGEQEPVSDEKMKKSVERALDYMVRHDEVVRKEDNIYELPPYRTIPCVLELDEEQIWNLYYQTISLGSGTLSETEWEPIHNKISTLLGTEEEAETDIFFVVGRSYTHFQGVHERLKELRAIPYREKTIRVKLRNKNKEESWKELQTGAVIYSVEKDKLYLLALRKKTSVVVDMETILDIEPTERPNRWYNSGECRRLVQTAFSVSAEKGVDVEVLFDFTDTNKALLEELSQHRPEATLDTEGDKLLYRDCISGLGDFSEYLRQYGGGCEVRKPQALRDMMYASAGRTLERYQVI